jgi:hypothetical protein
MLIANGAYFSSSFGLGQNSYDFRVFTAPKMACSWRVMSYNLLRTQICPSVCFNRSVSINDPPKDQVQ